MPPTAHFQNFLCRLPEGPSFVATTLESRPFEQCISYPDHPSPIRPVEKIFLEFKEPGPPPVYTPFLWKQVIRHFNVPYSHEHYFIQKLKDLLMHPTMMSFLGGRRAYPVLELLDQPKVTIEKKHLLGFGYVISFLTNSKVDVDGVHFDWSDSTGANVLYFNLTKKWG